MTSAHQGGTTHHFDVGNRLRAVVSPTVTETYRYDGHGRRVLAWTALGNKQSMYASNGQLMYQQLWPATMNKAVDYYYLSGSLVATRSVPLGGGPGTVAYQHTDALGSPVAVTDALGAVVERTDFDPYGNSINKVVDGVGYTGHVMDARTELVYMQQRYYLGQFGRFLGVDPIPASQGPVRHFNGYVYALSNPYLYSDPDGRQSVNVTVAIPEREQTREDKAAISLANTAQRHYGMAVRESGDAAAISAYNSTVVQYLRSPSPEAQKILDAEGRSASEIKAYREPGQDVITILPGFGLLGDESKDFPDYHGMEIGRGGVGAAFKVIAHEHGHVLDKQKESSPHSREAAASKHANTMMKTAPKEVRDDLKRRP